MPTQLILTSSVQGLGAEGDRVTVADGYARNFLLPRNLAVAGTASAVRQIENLKLKRAERERKELEEAQELARKIDKLSSTVELQMGETGKVFGSVTSSDIAGALHTRGFHVDRKAVLLAEAIKKLGTFEIPIRIHPQVEATFKLTVVSANQPSSGAPLSPETKRKSEKPAAPRKKS